MHKKIIAASLSIFFVLPALASAHTPNILTGGYWGGRDDVSGRSGIVSCTAPIEVIKNNGTVTTQQRAGACTSLCDLVHTAIHVIMLIMSVSLYAAAPILFAWGGVLILTAAGSAERVGKAKKIMTGTLIGVLLILSAFLIVRTFITVLDLGNFIPGFTGGTFECTFQ